MKQKIQLSSEELIQVGKLATLGCSDLEIYSVMGIRKTTWFRLKKEPALEEALEAGRSQLNVKLRRMQIELACSGSVPMLIHLGKSLLGQGNNAPPPDNSEVNPLMQFLPRAETVKGLPKSNEEA